MKTIAGFTLALGVLMTAPISLAQDVEDEQRRVEIEIEERARVEEELEREVEFLTREALRVAGGSEAEVRAAESRLAEAARKVAELSTRNLPYVSAGSWTAEFTGRPVLGVSVGAKDTGEPVEGVEILGVSPGGPADEAGLRAGDVLTSLNGESMSGDSVGDAIETLLDFMSAVDEGDTLEVEYLRAGKAATVDVVPTATPHVFSFNGGREVIPQAPGAPLPPGAERFSRYIFITDDGIGDMEMVTLNEGLGRYFGTDEGLLVVRAPKDAETYKLEDGDVILNIDGREPTSVSHALKILGSYQAGETLSIRVMRDKRERTLEVEIPDRRTGALNDWPATIGAPRPAAAPRPASAPRPAAAPRSASREESDRA